MITRNIFILIVINLLVIELIDCVTGLISLWNSVFTLPSRTI